MRRWVTQSLHHRVFVALAAMLSMLVLLGNIYWWWGTPFSEYERLAAAPQIHHKVYAPTVALIDELQHERLLTAEINAEETKGRRRALTEQRAATDRAVRRFRDGGDLDVPNGALANRRYDAAVKTLGKIDAARRNTDTAGGRAAQQFTNVITAGLRALDALHQTTVVPDLQPLISLQHAKEHLARQATLVAGALAAGNNLVPDERRTLREQRATADTWFTTAPSQAHSPYADSIRGAIRGNDVEKLRGMIDKVVAAPTPQVPDDTIAPTHPYGSHEWRVATFGALDALATADTDLAGTIAGGAAKAADDEWWSAFIVILIGLFSVVLALAIWVAVAPRHVQKHVDRISNDVVEAAEQMRQLPARLARGEPVRESIKSAPAEYLPDEFGSLEKAFYELLNAAVTSMLQLRNLDVATALIAANGRRNQTLALDVQRELTTLLNDDQSLTVEQHRALTNIDHLASLILRLSRNSLTFAGEQPRKLRNTPAPVIDVLRMAQQQARHYERVEIRPFGSTVQIHPLALADVVTVLAELIENAALSSQTVVVEADVVPAGLAVTIEDRGVGIEPDRLAAYNALLANPPSLAEHDDPRRQGLIVVGQAIGRLNDLAARLESQKGLPPGQSRRAQVTLKSSAYGGVTAVPLFPTSLLVNVPSELQAPAGPDITAEIEEYASDADAISR